MNQLSTTDRSSNISESDPSDQVSFHASTVDEIATRLNTKIADGLNAAEVTQRLQQFGANRLEASEQTNWYQVLGRQFKDVLIAILLIAAAVSVVVGEPVDAITILLIVVLNALLGFVQEWKAERAIQALQQMLSPRCQVLRDGTEQQIESADLVPGDIVQLAAGAHVPADLRLSECLNLKVDESALTGESLSVVKSSECVLEETPLAQQSSMAWMGTAVTAGHGVGIVTATGEATEFGRIATLTGSVDRDTTPLQRKLSVLGKQLGVGALLVSFLVFLVGWLSGKPLVEMFLTGVSLAVALVPEGLPAVVTLTLALGVRAMVRRRVLLRRLRAAEALGAATVVCTDKTGTLTQNQMTVTRIWLPAGEVDVTGVGYDPAGHFEVSGHREDYHQRPDLTALLQSSMECNHASLVHDEQGWHPLGEPTETALLVAAYKAWLDPSKHPSPLAEYSFDSNRKRMTVVTSCDTGMMAHVKGAPEVILERCSHWMNGGEICEIDDTDRHSVEAAYTKMAETGLRTLAIAQRPLATEIPLDPESVESQLVLLGIVGMMDPPRPEVSPAIELARHAGIKVFMITGDSPTTGCAIARQVGLSAEHAMTGKQLDQISDSELRQALENEVVFARTTPEHKLRIVTALQELGHIVGMTGDGVNDAPALKKADIGIAMGIRGTDVAKGASDIVLTDDNFSSIVGAIEEGRRQYDNIKKFVRYLLSSNSGEVVAIFLNIVMGGPLIFLPVQILWMNLVTDGMTAVALGLEPAEVSVMSRPPRDPKKPILDRFGVLLVLGLGTYIGLASLWLFHHYLASNGEEGLLLAQTVAFTAIVLIEKANVLNFRSLDSPLLRVGLFSNPWILVALVGTVLLQVAAVYVPGLQQALHTTALGWSDWGLILAFSLPIFLIPESIKILLYLRAKTRRARG
ncbi:MAG: calcium-translocating P-type ATPase, SERCA-type [Rubripirellula sp.]|nr:calcium-translocating P-type ATPase, SERCA-type [Rubripirellula sp.]